MEKILTADFSNGASQIRLRGIWQHDYGAKLKVKGIDYSTLVRIDFAGANDPKAYPVVAVQETDGTFTAKIPKEVTDQAYDINAYIYVSGNDAGYTVKEVVMPVRERVEADPASGGGTATDPYAAVIEKMTEFAEGAKTSAGNAALSADTAGKSASAAQQAARSAAESASTATAAAQTATTAAGKASESATTATQAAETAGQKATAAETAAGKAAESATAAEKSATAAKESATAAKASETAATASAVIVTEQAEKIKASAEQIEKNKTDVASLKEVIANVKAVTDTIDERILEAFFGSMRNGKVYQTEVYLTETNPTSDGVKTLANANMVCEPSTDTVEGRDDYEGIGIFNWFNCNYITDDYGRKIPTAIEGWGNGYKNDGSVDVGVIAMTPYWSVVEKDGKQIWTLSDTPNDDYGLIPWETARKEDGAYASYTVHSKYVSGLGTDGLLRSFGGSKPARNQCHNNMIDNYQKKSKGCWGAGKERDMYVILYDVIKYATKNEQKIFKGTTSYNLQFSASIQRDTKETYFPLTNSQASQIVVGSYVSVGYGSKNAGNTINNDRGAGTIHNYADDVKVLKIEDIDENNKAVYLDIEEGFTTTPVALSDTLNAQITLSTMHWWSGTTDKVIGKHDGSMGSNTDGKHPFRVMGLECS